MAVKILIVDDDQNKYENIRNSIVEGLVGVDLDVSHASNAVDAKRFLRDSEFDLMLLDIALPSRDGEEPVVNGGLVLLREIISRQQFKMPSHVVGITALSDVYQNASVEFEEELWSVIFYDPASMEWVHSIERKILHIESTRKNAHLEESYNTDICILGALQDEIAPLITNGWNWEQFDVAGDSTIYYRASITKDNQDKIDVVVARCSSMGMAAASALAMKMGITFKPRFMTMIGICAGDSGKVQFGDVIAGNPVWDYGSGKHSEKESGPTFQHAPYQITISTDIRGILERIDGSDELTDAHTFYSGHKPRSVPKIVIGPLASGAAVVANSEIFAQLQEVQHRKLAGLEMEAYGMLHAAQELPNPRPNAFVIKAVQDYADGEKNDDYRPYACHVSASVAKIIVEKYL